MILRLSCLLCCLFTTVVSLTEDKFLTTLIYKFLYSNENTCGDPFVDPEWLPAVEECSIGCDETRSICLVHAEDQMQMCRPLPLACIRALREHLGWSAGIIDETTTPFPTTLQTTTVSSTTTRFTGNAVHEIEFERDMLLQATAEEATESTTASFSVENEIDRESSFIDPSVKFREEPPLLESNGYDSFDQPPAFLIDNTATEYTPIDPLPPNPYETNEFLPPADNDLSNFFNGELSKKKEMEYSLPMRTDSPDNMQPIQTQSEAIMSQGEQRVNERENYVPIGITRDAVSRFPGTRIDLVPPPPPPDPVDISSADAIALSNTIQEFDSPNQTKTVTTVVSNDDSIDSSKKCCEWALQGLCDRSWQKVRKTCPKSCGSLVCEEIEGVKSCNRLIDVDVEDCFQSMRFVRYFGLRNVQTKEEKKSIIEGMVRQKLSRKTKRKLKKRKRLRS